MARSADEMIRGAFARARGRAALVHSAGRTPGGLELFYVGSSASVEVAYAVTVDAAGTWRCTCPAADAGREACWHKAASQVRRANDRARGEHLARAAGLIGPQVPAERAAIEVDVVEVALAPPAPRRLPPLEEGAPPPPPVPNVVALAREAERRARDEAILRPPTGDGLFKAEPQRRRARG